MDYVLTKTKRIDIFIFRGYGDKQDHVKKSVTFLMNAILTSPLRSPSYLEFDDVTWKYGS